MCVFLGMKVSRADFLRLKGIEKELKNLNMNRPLQHGYDYQDWPIIRPTPDRKDFTIEDAHWEFIPPYVKDEIELKQYRTQNMWLNAKSENLFVNDKGRLSIWSEAAQHTRCLVPCTYFIEYRHIPTYGKKGQLLKATEKIPYYITLKSQPEFFFLAGIWREWTNESRGQSASTFAIVTSPANHFMTQIHNSKKRMPTILNEDQAAEWLKGGLPKQRIMELAQSPVPSHDMIAWTIDKDFRKTQDLSPVEYDHVPMLDNEPG